MMAEQRNQEEQEVRLVRILAKDIRGDKKVLVGLTKIKGISWAISNAICRKLNIDVDKQIQDLSKEDIEKITEFMSNPEILSFLMNRQKDLDSGEDLHFHGSDLNLRKEFDIKRQRKIKSYKGIRHGLGLPVRGQRTKANFRKNKRKGATGIKKK